MTFRHTIYRKGQSPEHIQMSTSRVQHKATLSIGGRNVDVHAPPFVSVNQLELWIHDILQNPDVKLVSKTWGVGEAQTGPEAA